MSITIRKSDIVMRTLPDEDADASYLEQEGFEARRAEYDRGEFAFIGVRAIVDVEVRPEGREYSTLHTFTSGGVWGIEDDSDAAHLKELFEEERNELARELETMGFIIED